MEISGSRSVGDDVPRLLIPSHFTGLSQIYKESYLTAEYCLLSSQSKLGGLYVIPSLDSAFVWFGIIFVHNGPYAGGVFRFNLKFKEGFPDNNSLPIVTFTPKVFHPQIQDGKGIFELKRHFRQGYHRDRNHIWEILKSIRKIFYKIDTVHPLNKEAADLYIKDIDKFNVQAASEAESSRGKLYEKMNDGYWDDPHYIKFNAFNPSLHGPVLSKALQPLNAILGISSLGAPVIPAKKSSPMQPVNVNLSESRRGLSFMEPRIPEQQTNNE